MATAPGTAWVEDNNTQNSARTTSRRAPVPPCLDDYPGSTLRGKIEFASALLRWALDYLTEVQDMTPQAAFDGLAHVKKARRLAKNVERWFEDAGIAEMYHQGIETYCGHGYTAELRSGNDRKDWDTAELAQELIEQRIDAAHQRFPDLSRRHLRAVVTEDVWTVLKAARPEWRSRALSDQGIDPNRYSTIIPGPARIELRGTASYPTHVKESSHGIR